MKARRYEEITFCNTTQFVLVHSWTSGAAPLIARRSASCACLRKGVRWLCRSLPLLECSHCALVCQQHRASYARSYKPLYQLGHRICT